MTAWLLIILIWAVLWFFWLWLGFIFDSIGDWQAAAREARREALKAARERGD